MPQSETGPVIITPVSSAPQTNIPQVNVPTSNDPMNEFKKEILMQKTRNKSSLKWILIGCGGCGLITIICIVLFAFWAFSAIKSSSDAVKAVVQQACTTVNNNGSILSMMSVQVSTTEPSSVDSIHNVDTLMMGCTTINVSSVKYNSSSSTNDNIEASGNLEFPNGLSPKTINLVLTKENDVWKILSIQIGG